MSVVPTHEQRPHLSRAAVDALHVEMSLFDQKTRARGQAYAEEGHVSTMHVDGNVITATVFGTENYDAFWEWDGRNWNGECTCPIDLDCKHLYALASVILVEAQVSEPAPAPTPISTRRPSLQGTAAPRSKAGPAAAPRPRSPLQKLREEKDVWVRERALADLLAAEPAHGINLYMHPFRDLLREPDPDLRCWLIAQRVAEVGRGQMPKTLEPYLKRPDLEARQQERIRGELTAQLVSWAHERAAAALKSLRVVFLARPDGPTFRIGIEARLSATRINDSPRSQSQLAALLSEGMADRGVLAANELGLLRFLVEQNFGGSDSNLAAASWGRLSLAAAIGRLLQNFPHSQLVRWDNQLSDDFVSRTGVVPGGPVMLRSGLVSLLPVPQSHDGEFSLEPRFLWTDGTQKRPDEVIHIQDGSTGRSGQSLVVAEGAFWLVGDEIPPALQSRFTASGGLPLSADDRDRVIGFLAATFEPVRKVVARHTRFHTVQPVLALDLRQDDWLQLRIFAVSPDCGWRPGAPIPPDAALFELSSTEGWTRLDRRSATTAEEVVQIESASGSESTPAEPVAVRAAAIQPPEEVWAEAPTIETMTPLLDWIAPLGARTGAAAATAGKPVPWADAGTGWWCACTKKKMETFAEMWERRPPGVQIFGTDRVRRLLSDSFAIRPRLRVTKSDVDWFAVSAEWESEGLRLTDADLQQLRTATSQFVKLASGWVRRDVVQLHDETAALLADIGIEPGQGEQRITVWQLAGAREESLEQLAQLGADPEAIAALARLRKSVANFQGLPEVELPRGLQAEMRPYQRLGLDFLAHAGTLGIGSILADDMGLGKTIQALAWLQHLSETEGPGGPNLVVCPASVVHNWVREAERFTPGMRVLVLTSGAERHALRKEIPNHDLILTNYALLRRDIEEWKKLELRAVILDEAQNIKNPDAAVTAAACELRARHRIALTGTPLENRALDLWSISSFVNPGYLPERGQFVLRYDRPDAPPHVRTLLAAKLRPVLLRRTKKEVAPELPERIEERLDCEMTSGQRQIYLAEMRRSRTLVDKLEHEPGGIRGNKIHVLAALTRLRQICCHPALAGGRSELGSGKFTALLELLEPLLEEGHKVLLFSQFVECLQLLRAELTAHGIKHHLLTGQTQTAKRKRVVADFQEDPDPCVFLISLKAGGTGLNLTAASYVVLFDPWWNPAVEAQAIDRTHRIGQDRTVIAYRMIASGTIEEKIWELQQRKAALVRDILGGEEGFARSLTRDDLEFLLAEG